MDNDQRMNIAQQLDPVIAAAIINSIADVERDHRLAEGPLSEKLMSEIEQTIRKGAPQPWEVAKAEWTIWLSCPEWRPTKGLGRGDAWFEVNEIADDDEEGPDHTWIGVAVGAGKSALGIELMFRKGLASYAETVLLEKAQIERLTKIGLRKDASANRWYVPIAIDRLRLAKGFGENDLAESLIPVAKATAALVTAKSDLDALIELVRSKAKGK